MAAVKSSKKNNPKTGLSAWGLVGALSYWGTAARMVVLLVLLGSAYFLNIAVQTDWRAVDVETLVLIYGMSTLFVLDAGYIIAARALSLKPRLDRWVVITSDILLASFFVVPSFFIVGIPSDKLRPLSLFVALLIVSIRLLMGLLFTKRK